MNAQLLWASHTTSRTRERRDMAHRTHQQDVLEAVELLLSQQPRRPARTEAIRRTGNGRPIQYDESGYPIPQDRPNFAKRVARLLNV
jgi:hypothetical protein